jgi:hypothetical protein
MEICEGSVAFKESLFSSSKNSASSIKTEIASMHFWKSEAFSMQIFINPPKKIILII